MGIRTAISHARRAVASQVDRVRCSLVGRFWSRISTRRVLISPERSLAALTAVRAKAFALAVVVFILGFSLDDLHILRVPSYLVGSLLALFLIALGPLVMGRRFAVRNRNDSPERFQVHASNAGRAGLLLRMGALFLAVAWLVAFSAGVPPWAR